jgi:hypothetical protein
MPLPPLPDDAAIGGAGHIADSEKLEAYLRALAEQYKIDIGVLPDPVPNGNGHVAWHNAMVTAAKKVAAAIGAKVVLPPLDIKEGDKLHVTHHNQIAKALQDMSEAIPFSVEGGEVVDAYGWRSHTFRNVGTDKLIVKGTGKVEIICAGGGGGKGFQNSGTFPAYFGGDGGGGAIAEMSKTQTTVPSVVLNSGDYVVSIGKAGADSPSPSMPASNGANTTFVGADISLTGFGGGGGGSAQAGGNSAGTGGGGGGYKLNFETPPQVNRAGTGSQGGNGVEGSTNDGKLPLGGGGGALQDAIFEDSGGEGLRCDNGNWWDGAIEKIYGATNLQIGASAFVNMRQQSPAHGGCGPTFPATNGIVIVGYKLSQLLGGE